MEPGQREERDLLCMYVGHTFFSLEYVIRSRDYCFSSSIPLDHETRRKFFSRSSIHVQQNANLTDNTLSHTVSSERVAWRHAACMEHEREKKRRKQKKRKKSTKTKVKGIYVVANLRNEAIARVVQLVRRVRVPHRVLPHPGNAPNKEEKQRNEEREYSLSRRRFRGSDPPDPTRIKYGTGSTLLVLCVRPTYARFFFSFKISLLQNIICAFDQTVMWTSLVPSSFKLYKYNEIKFSNGQRDALNKVTKML